mgnify:CR=1 FL=1
MECFGMPVFKDYTREELKQIKIEAPEEQMRKKVQKNWDHVAKPLDGMGRFEALTAQIGAILGTEVLDLSKKAVLIFCADNGIVEEGISQSGQEVTAIVTENFFFGWEDECKGRSCDNSDRYWDEPQGFHSGSTE